MPLNEYGEKLDSNGYAPSILHDKPVCLICGRYGTARHEVYFGSAYGDEDGACHFGRRSCEDIAAEILNQFENSTSCTVLEDGFGGARVVR